MIRYYYANVVLADHSKISMTGRDLGINTQCHGRLQVMTLEDLPFLELQWTSLEARPLKVVVRRKEYFKELGNIFKRSLRLLNVNKKLGI